MIATRRLAAIKAVDVGGYSRLNQAAKEAFGGRDSVLGICDLRS
jgi:hypothetical protein